MQNDNLIIIWVGFFYSLGDLPTHTLNTPEKVDASKYTVYLRSSLGIIAEKCQSKF